LTRVKVASELKKKVEISETQLEEFIKKTIEFWKQGGNTDC